MAERKLITYDNLQTFADELKKKYAKSEELTQLEEKVTQIEEGSANKIEVIKVNGTVQEISPDDKSVNITVPTKLSDLTNDKTFQTKAEIDAAIAAKLTSTYKAGGSVNPTTEFASAPAAEKEGIVYNASAPFETNEHFVDGLNASYPAGTNVVAVKQEDGTYKWDVLAGFVDLTDYATTEEVTQAIADTVAELGTKDGFAKTEEVHEYVTQQLTNYYTSAQMDTKLGNYYTKTETDKKLGDYVKNADIVEIPPEDITALLNEG